jgi:hypothetical protein
MKWRAHDLPGLKSSQLKSFSPWRAQRSIIKKFGFVPKVRGQPVPSINVSETQSW